MAPRYAAPLLLCCAAAACGDRARPDPSTNAAAAPQRPSSSATAAATPSASASAPAAPSASASAAVAASAAADPTVTVPEPAGPPRGLHDCKLVRGPVKLTTIGAVTIGPAEGGLLSFATNKLGAPSWESPRFPEPPKPGATSLVPRTQPPAPAAPTTPLPVADTPEDRTRLPACALAAGFTFCVDADGQIHRRRVDGSDDKVIAKGRRGTPVSAASVAGHTFYAFLANQKTTEGVIVRAFAGADDDTPIPLSEDGSGATHVALVARDADVLAMYIDARTAMTPVHARTLRFEGGLQRGTDAVVIVGGGADGVVRGALGRAATGPAHLFVPWSPDEKQFGVIAIPVTGEPKDDMQGKWSKYEAAITSPSLAATSGVTPLRLVRARPDTAEPDAPLALELGHVDPDGTFRDRCVLAKAASFTDVTVAVDAKDTLWVAYTNGKGTWVEQRGGEGK